MMNMMRNLVFIIAAILFYFAANVIFVDGMGLRSRNVSARFRNFSTVCTDHEALMYSHEFHNCYIDRKYGDHAKDLENIVHRILVHSDDCIRNASRSCRPNYEGFLVIMEKVIYQMQDYCFIYLENISHGRQKIKDLDCMEKYLSHGTYKKCFGEVFRNEMLDSEEEFRRKVEKAISCTNKSHKQCSKDTKTRVNRMVRIVLRVEQPEKEDIEEEEPAKPWRWYDYIVQPIISLWKTIKSWFGWF